MTLHEDEERELHALKFSVQKNIRYHMRRGAFFLKCGRFTSFIGVVFGSAALTSILAKADPWVISSAALTITLVSAIDLVAGTGQRAWLHNDLRKRYLEIEGDLLLEDPATLAQKIRHYNALLRRIEADEPPTMPALELLARDDVIRAIYDKPEAGKHLCKLPWIKRTTAQWFDWDTSNA